MIPDVFIRTDAGPKVGWGHLIRTSAIAEGLAARGCDVIYCLRDGDAAARAFLEKKRFRIKDILPKAPPRPGAWLIHDSYHRKPGEQRAFRRAGWKLLCIDDFPSGRFRADVVVNPSLERCRYALEPGTTLLAGRKAVLLRRAFRDRKPTARRVPTRARNVLVSFGGGDALGLGPRICRLLRAALPNARLRLVAGPSAARGAISGATLLRSATAEEMRRSMEWCDLAVCTPSSTLWELCYLGVPAAVLGVADNQRPLARELKGLALDLGWADRFDEAKVGRLLLALANDPSRRRAMGRSGRKAVDGRGVQRVIRAMGL